MNAIAERDHVWDPIKRQYVQWVNRTDDLLFYHNDGEGDVDNEGNLVGPDGQPLKFEGGLSDAELQRLKEEQVTWALTNS